MKTYILGRTYASWAIYLAIGLSLTLTIPWLRDSLWHSFIAWIVISIIVPRDPIQRK